MTIYCPWKPIFSAGGFTLVRIAEETSAHAYGIVFDGENWCRSLFDRVAAAQVLKAMRKGGAQ